MSGVTQLPGAVGGPSALTSSLVPTLLSFLRRASLASCSVSLTSCLMNPPGMTENSSGGADGGGPRSSSRIWVWGAQLGHGAGTGTAAQPVSGSRAGHQHPAQAEALPSTRGAPGWVRDAVGAEAPRRKAQREAPRLVQPLRAGTAGAQVCCQLCSVPAALAQPQEGTILAAARQAAAPASPQPHAALQAPPCQAPGQNQPHFPQLFQQQHQHQTLQPPARLNQAGKSTQIRTLRLGGSPEPGGADTARGNTRGAVGM